MKTEIGNKHKNDFNSGNLNHCAIFSFPNGITAKTSMLKVNLALASFWSFPKGIESSYRRHVNARKIYKNKRKKECHKITNPHYFESRTFDFSF